MLSHYPIGRLVKYILRLSLYLRLFIANGPPGHKSFGPNAEPAEGEACAFLEIILHFQRKTVATYLIKEFTVYERCLNEAELILSVQQEPFMPVRKVWEEISRRAKMKGFDVASLSDFSAMLEGDSRFQLVPGQIKIQEDEEVLPDIDIEDSEMEQLGFFAEDRVKLRSKKIIETIVNEDEEEVGSIRRMSFAGQITKSKSLSISKIKTAASKISIAKNQKTLPKKKKPATAKRPKGVKKQKSKVIKRGKK